MKTTKTFEEYKKDSAIQEATSSQWQRAGRAGEIAVGLGIATYGLTHTGSTIAASGAVIGPAVAIPLAIWGMGAAILAGLLAGNLFADGTARQDYKDLKIIMKRLTKYNRTKSHTEGDINQANADISSATFLVRKLRETIHRDLQRNTPEGLLRRDLLKIKKVQANLSRTEKSLLKLDSKQKGLK